MQKLSSPERDILKSPSTYAERLEFTIWYAALELGVSGATKVSVAIGKAANTLSKWAKEQPSFEQSEVLANAAHVNATWLHNPRSSGAVEPKLFAKWLRSTRLADEAARASATTGDALAAERSEIDRLSRETGYALDRANEQPATTKRTSTKTPAKKKVSER